MRALCPRLRALIGPVLKDQIEEYLALGSCPLSPGTSPRVSTAGPAGV